MKAHPEWENNQIILDLDGSRCLLLEDPQEKDRWTHGTVGDGQVFLSLEDAKKLLSSLSSAISFYEEMDQKTEEYFSDNS